MSPERFTAVPPFLIAAIATAPAYIRLADCFRQIVSCGGTGLRILRGLTVSNYWPHVQIQDRCSSVLLLSFHFVLIKLRSVEPHADIRPLLQMHRIDKPHLPFV